MKQDEKSKEAEIFVSPKGDDTHAGTKAQPFKSLERARDAVRKLKGNRKVVVWLRGGIYEREKPFELIAEDSGSDKKQIAYRGCPGEEVRIVGGKVVTGWKPVSDETLLKRLTPQARGNVLQADLKALGITDYGQVESGGLELFFQDKPMTLARWPNQGNVKITGLAKPGIVGSYDKNGSSIGKFMYQGDRPKRWADEKDVWVHGYWFWDWSDQRHPVESIDTEKRIISVKPPYHNSGYRIGQWFYALNILAELDEPGEWYLDRETGILYFWPPVPIEKGRAVVSVLDTLVNFTEVQHVVIEGMIFEATRGTAVVMSDCSHARITGCVLRNIGTWAVQIVKGGSNNGIVSCDIYGSGYGGIILRGGERSSLTPSGHFADNNHIYNYARWKRTYTPAIDLQGVGNRASHNLIHDAPHMAMGFGGNDHLIEFNEIYNVCYESNDAGAIYAGRDWTMRGTVIRHNYLHNISGFRGLGCVGVYLDDEYCGTRIYGNVFYRVTSAAFIGGGRDCIVENNIFVDCPKAMHMDARAMGWASKHVNTILPDRLNAMPYKSKLWRKRYPKLVNILDDEPAVPKGNIITRNIFVGEGWNDITPRARKYVILKDNLSNEDPQFVAKPPKSFQLQDNSPAYKLGFKPIPFEKIGLYEAESRTSRAAELLRQQE